ncbi:MAG: type II toxin-antitoxin system RelE/ParE family toxin [Thermoanaerobaculia bacterium]
MKKPLRAQDEGSQELDHAARWYDERRPALGYRFLASVDSTLDQIHRFPQAGAPVPRVPSDIGARRAPVEGFPYHVIYLETAEAIHILAFAHDKRRPGYWLPRADAEPSDGD